jgi:hypothetical protein
MEGLGEKLKSIDWGGIYKTAKTRVKQYALNLSELEVKVEDATSLETWGPHGSAMAGLGGLCACGCALVHSGGLLAVVVTPDHVMTLFCSLSCRRDRRGLLRPRGLPSGAGRYRAQATGEGELG